MRSNTPGTLQVDTIRTRLKDANEHTTVIGPDQGSPFSSWLDPRYTIQGLFYLTLKRSIDLLSSSREK